MSVSNEQPVDGAFTLAIGVGMNLAAELVNTFGPRRAMEALGTNALTNFTADELGILAAAFQLVLAQREPAPDDLSALGEVPAAPCPDPSCRICRGEGR